MLNNRTNRLRIKRISETAFLFGSCFFFVVILLLIIYQNINLLTLKTWIGTMLVTFATLTIIALIVGIIYISKYMLMKNNRG